MSSSAPETRSSWQANGLVCLITGATAGIGRAAAFHLAPLGAELVLVGRDHRRLRRVERELTTQVPSARVRTLVADLASLDEVRSLASVVRSEVPRLKVLVCNAGVFANRRTESKDGHELQFAVNHLAPFLLTNLLLPLLKQNAPSRVVVVASQVERQGSLDFDDLQGRRDYDGMRAYRQSKLANILFVRELARRLAGTGVTALSLHPGVYSTRLLDDFMGWSSLVTRLRGRGGVDEPDAGGAVVARAVVATELAGQGGVHLHENEVRLPSEQARSDELATRLWQESAQLSGVQE